jgi:Glyoxalase-like domain
VDDCVMDVAVGVHTSHFWAAGLEYEVEDPSALISQLLAASARRRSLSTAAAESFAATPRYDTPRIRSTRAAASAAASGWLFQEVPKRKSGKNRVHIDVHSEPGASMSWLPGWRSWGQPASVRSMRDLQDAGWSCNTPKAMSSARRNPGAVPRDAALTTRG